MIHGDGRSSIDGGATKRQVSTAARPWSTVQTGSVRVRTEFTKAFSESRVLLVWGPPDVWSGASGPACRRSAGVEIDTPFGADQSSIFLVELAGCDPAMNDVHEHAAGVFDNTGVIVVNVAVGLEVAEQVVASECQARTGCASTAQLRTSQL